MNTPTQIRSAIDSLIKELAQKKKELGEQLLDGLKPIFSKYPSVQSFSFHVNNHEFNDGEPTYFSINCEDPSLTLTDGTEVGCYSNDSASPEQEVILEEIAAYFSQFDVDDLFEELFGDAYGTLTIQLQGDKVVAG